MSDLADKLETHERNLNNGFPMTCEIGRDMQEAAARIRELEAELAALREARGETLQARTAPWMDACFGREISNDRLERGDRFLEEVFELLQSGDYPVERVASLRDYVWSRDVGEPAQEVGGVMITLAAYCLAHNLDMHEAGETELARIWTKVDKIRAKHAAKPKHSPLPIALEPAPVTPAEAARNDAKVALEHIEAVEDAYTRWMLAHAVGDANLIHRDSNALSHALFSMFNSDPDDGPSEVTRALRALADAG